MDTEETQSDEDHLKRETEIAVMHLQTKDHQGLLATTRS